MFNFPRFSLFAAAVFAVVVPLGCGGGVGDFVDSQMEEGLEEFRKQVQTDIKDNPVLVDKIGTIQSFELDIDASEEVPGENDFVFNVKGSKGEGVLTATCITIDEYTEDVTAGTLRMSTGETVDLFPGE